MIPLINDMRRENEVSELTVDQRLMAAAQECSNRKYTFHHNKEECEEVIARGYPYGFGNNLCILTAAVPADIVQRTVTIWVNFPGHFRAAGILGARWRTTSPPSRTMYWTPRPPRWGWPPTSM